ncbi:hypothetical protein [Streptomyces sp. KN37]|uniref:hypothetical protein n=1 Tax=Streptomyces sp. KN37 TaxID=3090667 RepID=UPI002A75D587|nr:hypothetical protein [Streptomyces sp. KN37]WPO69937.1 hypothetical protein R9806_04475 [Streptomyces sp. KN37]
MNSRTRTSKAAAGVHTVRIPRRRGRRGQPFIVVIPEHPTVTRVALGTVGRALWKARTSLYPTALAVLGFVLAAVRHVLAWWSCFLPATAVVAPVAWLAVMQRSNPACGSSLAWRIGLTSATSLAASWLTTAVAFGPTAGPLELLWLLALLGTQIAWPIVRRTY